MPLGGIISDMRTRLQGDLFPAPAAGLGRLGQVRPRCPIPNLPRHEAGRSCGVATGRDAAPGPVPGHGSGTTQSDLGQTKLDPDL